MAAHAETQKYRVLPTGQSESNQYTDISMTGLFGSHIAVLNSERQTIWQRYNSMLVANSFFLSFLDRQHPRFGALAGLLLCAAWWITTWSGYRLFSAQIAELAKFEWPMPPKAANPMVVSDEYVRGGDWIRKLAFTVIVLFAVIYLKLLIWG